MHEDFDTLVIFFYIGKIEKEFSFSFIGFTVEQKLKAEETVKHIFSKINHPDIFGLSVLFRRRKYYKFTNPIINTADMLHVYLTAFILHDFSEVQPIPFLKPEKKQRFNIHKTFHNIVYPKKK